MDTRATIGRSQKGEDVLLYNSVSHPGHTYTFYIKSRNAEAIAVRCQVCRSANVQFKKEGTTVKQVPYIRVVNGQWTEDPDYPKNRHFCVSNRVVDTSTSLVATRQIYRKAAQACDVDSKRPKSAHNNMAAGAALSPSPADTENPAAGNRWIIYHAQDRNEPPMIVMAGVAGLACLHDVEHVACDGNFKYNPKYKDGCSFYQIYSMHSIYQDLPQLSESVLSVIALLSSKDGEVYRKLFTEVKDALIAEFGDLGTPKQFHFHMEVSAMNACRQVFPEDRITSATSTLLKMDNSPETPRVEHENAVDMLLSAVARLETRPLHPLSEQLSEKMSDQVESPQGSEKFDHLFALMEKVAEKVDTLEAKQQQAAVKEKPLKSTRLDVQVQLNAEWINRLNQLAAEVGENQSLSALIEDMKFFEDRQSAHPEMSLAQCVQEALDKFTDIEAARPAQLPSATRKRPFPRSGGGGARTSVAFNYRDNQIASLAAQVQQLQQQTQYAIGVQQLTALSTRA
ncbi:hypothetical protein QR680_012984 [Steinernema hermaphroditum]|uniref:Uncharacterized protein n=1 Tax=Steinernema hermaphroditum TaxID=289476 RepID=A0AA39I3Z9_9BILA|nr:hypothetical protein QR680_012984 [Steinernema hermaphroditum]